MHNKDFELDIDNILAEFSGEQSSDSPARATARESVRQPEDSFSFEEEQSSDSPARAAARGSVRQPEDSFSSEEEQSSDSPARAAARESVRHPADSFSFEENRTGTYASKSNVTATTVPWQNPFDSDATSVWQPAEDRITHYADRYRNQENKKNSAGKFSTGKFSTGKFSTKLKISGDKVSETIKTLRRKDPKKSKTPKTHKNPKEPKESLLDRVPDSVLSASGAVLSALCLLFILFFVNPAAGSSAATVKKNDRTVNLTEAFTALTLSSGAEIRAAEAAQEAASEQTPEPAAVSVPEKIHYTIPETDLVAPAPEAACFGSVMPDSASEIDAVIQRARDSGLIGAAESTVFRSDASFRTDTAIRYYLDDTLLVICWKELIDGNTCSCAEIKIADASQFRRKFADDAFGSSNSYYATDLAKSVNAVAAMNADYYLFRDFGIVVYNRELYRFNESTYSGSYKKYNCVDTCFINEAGDLLYFRKGQETTEEELRQYIAEQNILFSIAFGPVLVENGEAVYTDSYPVGEIDKGYSRAGFGQVDTLHYFYMNLNHSDEKQARWDINTFAGHFAEKGVRTAYAFDGGQTGELVFQGEPYNYIDFGAERLVSDIIYFATALPGEEAAS